MSRLTCPLTLDSDYNDAPGHTTKLARNNISAIAIFSLSIVISAMAHWVLSGGRDHPRHLPMFHGRLQGFVGARIGFASHSCCRTAQIALDAKPIHEGKCNAGAQLQDVPRQNIVYLPYPYGRLSDAVSRAMPDDAYASAFLTRWCLNGGGADSLRIRRIALYGTDDSSARPRYLRSFTNDYALLCAARNCARCSLARRRLGAP